MKLLIDMNMSPSWPKKLGLGGIEAVHWSQIGPADHTDVQIMAYAAEHGFVVFTNDLDFGHLLALTNAALPSVIQVRVGNLRPSEIGHRVLDALLQLREELVQGALVTIDPERVRVRVLPLNRN